MPDTDISIPVNSTGEEIFLGRLRQLTAPQHQKLELHPLSRSLMQSTISLSIYADYLVAMSAVMREYDAVVLPFLGPILPDSSMRRRSVAIENDIAYLESKNVPIRTGEKFKMPELKNHAVAMGVAYVLEGSTLGGRIIIKHLQRFFSVTEDEGAQFFAGYGSDTGLRWKQFLNVLTNFAIKEKCENEIIAAAQACFDFIYNHFDKSCTLNEV